MTQLIEDRGIGDNMPPSTTEVLSENYAKLLAEVEAIAKRADAAPKAVKGLEDLDPIGSIVRDAADLWQRVDLARKMEKEPHLKAEREVDGFFREPLNRVDRIKLTLTTRASDYQRRVAAEARAKADAEARRLREEEARRAELARKAEEANRPKHADQHAAKAEEAARQAEQAEAAAAAPAKEIVRTVTPSGITAGGRSEWVGRIVDFNAIPLDALRPYFKRDAIEAAIRLAVKQGVRELKGVEIAEELKATFR